MNYVEMTTDWVKTPTGLFLAEDTAMDYARRLCRPKAIDLFCGCGGFSLGTIEAGFEVVCGLDNDPYSTVTYLYNLGAYPCDLRFVEDSDRRKLEKHLASYLKKTDGNLIKEFPVSGGNPYKSNGRPGVSHFIFGDIKKVSGKDILRTIGFKRGELDLLVGSPPCQGFSTAGKRDVLDPRNSLVFDFARLVCEIQPKALCMENVPGIMNMMTPEGMPVMAAFCRILEDGDFGGFNAFRRSLEAQGVAGLMRGKPKKKINNQDQESQPAQERLF